MKLGVVFIIVGTVSFIALVVLGGLAIIMGDYSSAVWLTVYNGIAGGLFIWGGIKRVRKANSQKQEGINA